MRLRSRRRRSKVKKILRALVLIPVVAAKAWLHRLRHAISRPKETQKKLLAITTGWYNYNFPDSRVERLAKSRAAICSKCPLSRLSTAAHYITSGDKLVELRGIVCTKCSCPLSAKTRSVNDSCPEGKW